VGHDKQNLHKLQALPWAERWLLLEAAAWLGLVRAALWLIPFRRIVTWMGLAQGESQPEAVPALAAQAAQVGWAVQAVARRTPWQSACLAQALAGSLMLRRRGLPGTLYLGVSKDAAGPEKLAAHAWLRCGDHILTGANGHERFKVISTFKL
jgi:hypothetical protein